VGFDMDVLGVGYGQASAVGEEDEEVWRLDLEGDRGNHVPVDRVAEPSGYEKLPLTLLGSGDPSG